MQPLTHQPKGAEPGTERPSQQQGRQGEHQYRDGGRRMVGIHQTLPEPGPQPEAACDGQEAVHHIRTHQPGAYLLPQLPDVQAVLHRHQPPAEQQQLACASPQPLAVERLEGGQRPPLVPEGKRGGHQPHAEPEQAVCHHQPDQTQQAEGEAPLPTGARLPRQQHQIGQAGGHGHRFNQAHASPS
ncbi:hypothetical protein D3C72_1572350 [compost metagenome]